MLSTRVKAGVLSTALAAMAVGGVSTAVDASAANRVCHTGTNSQSGVKVWFNTGPSNFSQWLYPGYCLSDVRGFAPPLGQYANYRWTTDPSGTVRKCDPPNGGYCPTDGKSANIISMRIK